ncbi:MAG TPA: Holliday junction resolvase RuvX [Mycobacteriales bacterium]|jgi:putative Holliday junction resolvase|nr:Holliday junction resolvase RuvX [Mycobacteriales bacterium]
MHRGVRLGVDVGSVRVGVAASDPDGVLASPVAVLQRDPKRDSDLAELARLAKERDAVEIVVGLPRSLSGREGTAAKIARDYASSLAQRVAPVSVRLVDERLSTVEATRDLQRAGVRARAGRRVIDAAAATVILQHALDADRQAGPDAERGSDRS